MPLTLVRYGRYSGGAPESATGNITAGQSRACVFDPLTDNAWFSLVGFVGGKQSGNVTAIVSVYDTDASKNPDDRLGYSDDIAVTTVMVGGGDGTHYTAGIAQSDNGPGDGLGDIMGHSGHRLALDIYSGSNAMRHSMVAAGSITADNEQFYTRTSPLDGSSHPDNPYGAYSASVEGHITAYLQGYKNQQPEAPSNNIYPTGSINEIAPVFTADFDDLNGDYGTANGGYDSGDELNQYKIQLRQVGTTTLLWNVTYSATADEKNADAINRPYGGSPLTRGVQYEWRLWMSDAFDDLSNYSDTGSGTGWFTFTPANLGFVTLDSDPTGKIEDNTPDFKGRWNHQSATTMKTVQVRLKNASGVVLQTGADFNIADVASSAAPGTLFTVPWADTGFSTLAWGTSYRYEIRGFDGTQWSDWSAYRTFSTNKAPSIASNHSPANGTIVTAYPKLTFALTDTDDTVATGLQAWTDVTDPGFVVHHFEATYNATTGLWESQLTAAEVPSLGTYQWAAYGYDGTIYSGEAASAGAALLAATGKTFVFGSGPVVTVTAPTDGAVLTAAAPTVSWSVAGQVKYQVVVYEDNTLNVVFDSGLITGAATSIVIPSGYIRNGESYDIVVSITNATPLVGSSPIVNVSVAFTEPTDVANFQVAPAAIGIDPWETAIRLTWDQTAYSTPEFQEYTIYRSADGGPDAEEIILARITSPATVQFIDYCPASGYQYTYGISVTIVTGLDALESERVSDSATVTLLGVVLTLLSNGGTYRACLLRVRERSFDRQLQETIYLIGQKPVTVRGEPRYWHGDYEGLMVTDTVATARQRWAELDALDAENGIVCIRDDWQQKHFVKITGLSKTDDKAGFITYQFGVREEHASEGEV